MSALPLRKVNGWTAAWFALTTLISAFLVFQVQPVISKTVLPWFGGSPAVWTTCMLFFQVLLFAGYGYAHFSTRLLKLRTQAIIHFALLVAALCLLPITPNAAWKPHGEGSPTTRILLILFANVGLPYFLLAATGPLVQFWFSRRLPERSPYRLYALSNIGSLSALLSYPFLVEPALSTTWQTVLWSLGFCLFALTCGYVTSGLWRACGDDLAAAGGDTVEWPAGRRYLAWLLLPAFASVSLLATTNHLCQDIAVIPFLWVAPLSLYLVTFIVCFAGERWYSRRWCGALATLAAVGLCVIVEKGFYLKLLVEVGSYLYAMFWVCMVCHGELYRSRPDPKHLTVFYLMSSAGGALGGVVVAILCPVVFSTNWEMNLCIVGCAAVGFYVFLDDARHSWLGDNYKRRLIASLAFCGVLAYAGLVQLRSKPGENLLSVRNFYGVIHVRQESRSRGKVMVHGRTTHGFQFADPRLQQVPTTYYGPETGVGLTLQNLVADRPLHVGIVGLGVGTLAAYGRPGDHYRFYEINPAVVEIARQHFSFLGNCRAECQVVLGDARLSLEREPSQQFDLLVLDAFSSDSIPTHLLTREAFEIYRRHIRDDGVIAVHASNRNLRLDPIVMRLAQACQLNCVQVLNPDQWARGTLNSKWLLLTTNQALLDKPDLAAAVRYPARSADEFPLWTDQYNNLFQILHVY